jgi:hypothetical protein
LGILAEVRETYGCPVLTDVHLLCPSSARPRPRPSTCCRSRRSYVARRTCWSPPAPRVGPST